MIMRTCSTRLPLQLRVPGIFPTISQSLAYATWCTSHSAGAGLVAACLRALRQSSNDCATTKKEGTKRTARQVEAIMPVKTVMPIDLRALAPAPCATTSGATSFRQALTLRAQIACEFDDQDGILGRERDQENEPDLHVKIILDLQCAECEDGSHERQRHGENNRDR